jgi:hypothetical protein
VVSPTVLHHFAAGFTREGEFWQKLSAEQDWPEKIGLSGVNTGPGNAFPRIAFTDGFTTLADDSKTVGSQVNNAWQLNDTVSWIRGNHSFKFGGEARLLETNGADLFLSQGSFSFNALETGLPGVANTGNAFASFLLGQVNRAEQNVLAYVPSNRYKYLAGFAQDDWKLTRRLTLNMGLRYEIYFPRSERNDNLSGFDPDLPNPGAGGRLGAIGFLGEGPERIGRGSFADTDYRAFGPRAGFAFALTGKTVLRGGYGIYYAPGNATAGLRWSQALSYGYNARPTPTTPNNGVTPAFHWDAGFPQNFARPPFIDPTVANGQDVNMIGRGDGRSPYFQNFTVSIQRELPGRVLIEPAYVGVKGTRMGTNLIWPNELDPRYLSLGSALLASPISSPAAQAAGIATPYPGFTGSVAQALRPYPQFLNISNRSNPSGSSTYHALQVKGEKRFSYGLTFLTAYTWAKTLTDGNVQAGGGPSGQTFYDRSLEKAVSTDHVPHVFVVSYIYELPFGPDRRFLNQGIAAKIAGGWSITGIHQYSAGKPIELMANNTLPLFNQRLRPDAMAGVDKKLEYSEFDPMFDRYINPAAFSAPAPLRFGTAARSYTDLRGFAYLNESFGAIKRTPLTEKVTLTFRAEFFNALNRVVLNQPSGNISTATFGRVSGQANTPRQGQLALRVDF